MPTLVAIYGGTTLDDETANFVRHLVRFFLRHEDVVLVTGGFSHWIQADAEAMPAAVDFETAKNARPKESGGGTSVDFAVADCAAGLLSPDAIKLRFQTWLPKIPRKGVQRYKMGLVRKLRGSPRARRLGLVHGIDALVTIKGQTETSLVLDAAIAIQLPALPIGFTGGDSENFWFGEEDFFKSTLHLSSSLARSIGTGPEKGTEESLAREIVDTILKNARRTCLVLMPFSDNDRTFYDSVITGAVRDAGFRPVRLDDDVLAGHIPSHFVAHVRNASEVIVDITGTNPNVMYELGHVHHHGVVEPLILKRKEGGTEEIPFYLQNHKVIYYTDDDHSRVRSAIMEHLTSRRREAVASAET